MIRPALIAVLGLATLVACQSAPAQTPSQPAAPSLAPPAPAAQQPVADIDPFTLAIETGRWQVIIDRASEGVREIPSLDADEDNTLRIDRQLKSGALALLALRNDACAKQLASARICTFIDWPVWALEPPRAGMDLATLQQRSDWLGDALSQMSGIGCAAGREATGDEQFCSVE